MDSTKEPLDDLFPNDEDDQGQGSKRTSNYNVSGFLQYRI